MGSRLFKCVSCDKSWETSLPGRFTTCDACKEEKLILSRTKSCGYRNCSNSFLDKSSKNSCKFCCDECGRREKAFRSGKALDESHFRVFGKSEDRKCHRCSTRFTPEPGEQNIRCFPCREELRNKSCRACSTAFRDSSLKNSRRFCDLCSEEPERIRPVGVSSSRNLSQRDPDVKYNLATLEPFTNTWFGKIGERLFLNLFPEASDSNVEYGGLTPFDCLHPTLGRVQVRTAREIPSKKGLDTWNFQVSKSCDTHFLVGFSNDRMSVVRAWLVPTKDLPDHLKVMSPDSREYTHKEFEFSRVQEMREDFKKILDDVKPRVARTKIPTRYARSLFGGVGEALYAHQYPSSKHVSKDDPTSPFDFLDPEGTRVDVKVRSLSLDRPRWTFFRSANVDVFHFYGFDRHCKKLMAVFRVPSEEMPPTGFSINPNSESKWDRFRLPVPDMIEVPPAVSTLMEITGLNKNSLQGMSPTERSEFEVRVFNYYRGIGFPFPLIPRDDELRKELSGIPFEHPNDGVYPILKGGTRVLSAYMRHRYESRNINADFSAVGAFSNDQRLQRAIRFCLSSETPNVTPDAVLRSLTALNRTPGHFSPKLAYSLVNRYCSPGGRVLDPCSGWGGRMLGTLLSGRSYLGMDPDQKTISAAHRVGERLRNLLGVTPPELLCSAVQDAELDPEFFDFALTSPPFWTQEVYGNDPQYGTLAEWTSNFLDVMFRKVFRALRPGSCFVVHASDFGSTQFVQIVRDSAIQEGFQLEAEHKLMKASFGSNQERGRFDPLLVFRRPPVG